MLGSNAGVRGKECEKLSWLEVGPEVFPPSLRRSRDAGCNVFLLVQVGPASSHGPVLAQLALQKVFCPRSEARDIILSLREDPLREEVWRERRKGETSCLRTKDGSKKEVGLPTIVLQHN